MSFDLIRHSLNEYILCALAIGEHCWHAQIHSIQQQDQYATQNFEKDWFDLETDAMSDSARIPDFARIFFVFLRGLVAGVNSLNTWGMFLEAVSTGPAIQLPAGRQAKGPASSHDVIRRAT